MGEMASGRGVGKTVPGGLVETEAAGHLLKSPVNNRFRGAWGMIPLAMRNRSMRERQQSSVGPATESKKPQPRGLGLNREWDRKRLSRSELGGDRLLHGSALEHL